MAGTHQEKLVEQFSVFGEGPEAEGFEPPATTPPQLASAS